MSLLAKFSQLQHFVALTLTGMFSQGLSVLHRERTGNEEHTTCQYENALQLQVCLQMHVDFAIHDQREKQLLLLWRLHHLMGRLGFFICVSVYAPSSASQTKNTYLTGWISLMMWWPHLFCLCFGVAGADKCNVVIHWEHLRWAIPWPHPDL